MSNNSNAVTTSPANFITVNFLFSSSLNVYFKLCCRTDIGVITPYTRQVKEIVEKLSTTQVPKGVEIRTVDGFQGREKNIILISLVRSNSDNEIGFLISEQRMNVLLTRAKCAMIVFGNKSTLISNHLWKQWIESVPNISSTQFLNQCLTKQNSTATKQHKYNKNRNKSMNT